MQWPSDRPRRLTWYEPKHRPRWSLLGTVLPYIGYHMYALRCYQYHCSCQVTKPFQSGLSAAFRLQCLLYAAATRSGYTGALSVGGDGEVTKPRLRTEHYALNFQPGDGQQSVRRNAFAQAGSAVRTTPVSPSHGLVWTPPLQQCIELLGGMVFEEGLPEVTTLEDFIRYRTASYRRRRCRPHGPVSRRPALRPRQARPP